MKPPLTPQAILQQIAQIQHMERGKICVMGRGPHGPYLNHQCWEKGKNHSRYLPQRQQAVVQEAIEGYQRFQQLTEQYAQLIIEKTRAELSLGAKKKKTAKSRRRSSWPKTRKSNN
jgi:hypothetical protein